MPRFQFSLRTLLIVVTLLAIPCWYGGEQYRLVARRKTILQELKQRSGYYDFQDGRSNPGVPWLRASCGDRAIRLIGMPHACSNRELGEMKACFPEARVVVLPVGFSESG